MVAGRSSLYAVVEITLITAYGPANLGVNFLVGQFQSIGLLMFRMDKRTWSPSLNIW